MSQHRDVRSGDPSGGDADAADLLAFVAGTSQRWHILEALADGERGLREVADRFGAPRTTVRHNCCKMAEEGLIEEVRHQTYRITPLGQGVLMGLESYREYVTVVDDLAPFFECVCPDDLSLDVRSLADATLTVGDRSDPYAPMQRILAALDDAGEVAGAMATMPPLADEALEDLLCETETRFVVSAEMAHILLEEQPSAMADAVHETGYEVRVGDIDRPYGLVVADGTTLILGLDGNDKPHAVVEVTDAAVREWAREEIARRTRTAAPLAGFLADVDDTVGPVVR